MGLSKLFLARGHTADGDVIFWVHEGSGRINYSHLADVREFFKVTR
ncbi:MAG: hypothetical protein JRK53_16040 [Deltaproteobacteria bacterium]|nr:hypothetical protein [Deltaproteobacteria bacterium]